MIRIEKLTTMSLTFWFCIEKLFSTNKYLLNRPRPRHGYKYTKYKMCLSIMMVICIKQHLNNIWSLIDGKVKQHWVWVEKKPYL